MGSLSKRKKNLRVALYITQGGKCYWCQQWMILKTKRNGTAVWDSPSVCTIDHLTLRSNGGTYHPTNVVASCRWCNNRQHFDRDFVNPYAGCVVEVLKLLNCGHLSFKKLVIRGFHNDTP